jgi:hypothetical protein
MGVKVNMNDGLPKKLSSDYKQEIYDITEIYKKPKFTSKWVSF